MIRKSFSRQLVKGNGFWWFDMWGGWYNDPDLLDEMKQMKDIYADSLTKHNRKSIAEVAVFADESAYKYLTESSLRGTAFNQREALGFMGAAYDMYDVSDFEAVYQNYKAIIFVSDLKTDYMSRAHEICRKNHIKYISTTKQKKNFSSSELRAFCAAQGVHIWCKSDDIVYVNDNYLAIHATDAGEKTIYLNGVKSCRELLAQNGIQITADTIKISMKENETKLFEITE